MMKLYQSPFTNKSPLDLNFNPLFNGLKYEAQKYAEKIQLFHKSKNQYIKNKKIEIQQCIHFFKVETKVSHEI